MVGLRDEAGMGAMRLARVAMGEWSVYLHETSASVGNGDALRAAAPGRSPVGQPARILRPDARQTRWSASSDGGVERGLGFAVAVQDVPKVIASLEAILSHPRCRMVVAGCGSEVGVWSEPVTADGMVCVFGPVLSRHFGSGTWESTDSIEFDYRDLHDLRTNLAGLD